MGFSGTEWWAVLGAFLVIVGLGAGFGIYLGQGSTPAAMELAASEAATLCNYTGGCSRFC